MLPDLALLGIDLAVLYAATIFLQRSGVWPTKRPLATAKRGCACLKMQHSCCDKRGITVQDVLRSSLSVALASLNRHHKERPMAQQLAITNLMHARPIRSATRVQKHQSPWQNSKEMVGWDHTWFADISARRIFIPLQGSFSLTMQL